MALWKKKCNQLTQDENSSFRFILYYKVNKLSSNADILTGSRLIQILCIFYSWKSDVSKISLAVNIHVSILQFFFLNWTIEYFHVTSRRPWKGAHVGVSTNPSGIELCSHANAFFCFGWKTCLFITWVKTLNYKHTVLN